MFERCYRFGVYAFTILLTPVRWFFGLVRAVLPDEPSLHEITVGLSRRLGIAASHRLGLIAASLHAAGVALRAALPIGFDAHQRRAGFALA